MTDIGAGQPSYGIGALARRLGVAPATVRDWEHRYGLTPTGRTAGGHRRYSREDMARLERMHRLILDGVAPAEAASFVSSAGLTSAGLTSAGSMAGAAGPAGAAAGQACEQSSRSHQARGLMRAAMTLDGPAIGRILSRSVAGHGVAATWEQLVRPVLSAIGERCALTGDCVDVEHLLSAEIIAAMAARAAQLQAGREARPILLACAAEEQHSLPLYALAAALAEQGISARMLGPRVPAAALAQAVARTGPAAVFIWSQTFHTGDAGPIRGVPSQRPPVRLLLAGGGWQDAPPGTETVRTLAEAVTRTVGIVGAP